MTDVTKVGVPNPAIVNRPTPPAKTDESKDGANSTSKADGPARAQETFRLPAALAAGQDGPQSAADALRIVFDSLQARLGEVSEDPPQTAQELEDLLSDIKVAAPFLDRVLAARKEEVADDPDARAALEEEIVRADAALAEARAQLEAAAENLPDEAPEEDPALTGALNAVLGADREIPTFSAEELRAGRLEFTAMVFDDIADALNRHRGQDLQAASYTLGTLGGANLTA